MLWIKKIVHMTSFSQVARTEKIENPPPHVMNFCAPAAADFLVYYNYYHVITDFSYIF